MGLSSKQVVSGVGDDVSDWSHLVSIYAKPDDSQAQPPQPTKAQHQQQQAATTPQKRQAAAQVDPAPPALRCPRCESSNTKFCYYNNYSRSQPRYLCKACRRHWTSGGTLRNVPVGGSRKSKKPRTSTASASAAAATATNACSANANNNASPPSSSSILLQNGPSIHSGANMDAVVQTAPFIPYASLLDVPDLDYLNPTSTGVCGRGANLAHLFSLPPLSIPFSAASLGSFLDLASSCSGGDAPMSNMPPVSPFFPFVGQPDASTGAAAPVNDAATSSAWHTSSGPGLLLPNSADASSPPNVLSPPATAGAAGSCAGMMTASWVDDFAGLISPMQQQPDYHLF